MWKHNLTGYISPIEVQTLVLLGGFTEHSQKNMTVSNSPAEKNG